MSSRELIESLRRAGDENARLLRQNAEREAETLRQSLAERNAAVRQRYNEELAAVSREQERRLRAEAAGRARAIRLTAEQAISERMAAICRDSLPKLRRGDYPAFFEKLARELPALPWKIVRVHLDDVELARKLFPEAEIVPTAAISGGLDVALADGSIRVINTFEKRLERAWEDLLPLLMRDAYREVPDEASSGAA
jgi:vacuolar-type H+-ATPase subunit E/Vma4